MHAQAKPAGPQAIAGRAESHTESRRWPGAAEQPEFEPGARRLRLIVVDDHEVVHWGFRLMFAQIPWVERCIGARSGSEALALCHRYRPHVALIDLFLDGESGPQLCAQLRQQSPQLRAILMSGAGGISPRAARAAGASGFISKEQAAPDIAAGVRAVGSGAECFQERPEPAIPRLSERELEILALIAAGSTNREIAGRLYLSPHTVKEYTSGLYRKLGARNRAGAVQRAQALGLPLQLIRPVAD